MSYIKCDVSPMFELSKNNWGVSKCMRNFSADSLYTLTNYTHQSRQICVIVITLLTSNIQNYCISSSKYAVKFVLLTGIHTIKTITKCYSNGGTKRIRGLYRPTDAIACLASNVTCTVIVLKASQM